jgi:hypothetical protein
MDPRGNADCWGVEMSEAHGSVPLLSTTGRPHVDISQGDVQCNWVYFREGDDDFKMFCGLPRGHEGLHENAYGSLFPEGKGFEADEDPSL